MANSSAVSNIWNALPSHLSSIPSLHAFRRDLERTGGSRNLLWRGQTKVPNRKLEAKPESRARSARVSRAKAESRARSARELRAKPEKKRGEGSGEGAR